MPVKDHDEFLRYEVEPRVRLSTAVAGAIAIADESSFSELPPLTAAVDSDALNTLGQGEGFESATFLYNGYRVTIDRREAVIITRIDADPPE